ncbi:baseplate J/gp47 family protein [Burkholderia vietnamiensis]|uniref:baseplate J/gp47 family protein n=1 Tax=Burkholderia vietnamiensis TaxID=60552 RepID=UPI002654CD46|nr:baseplate J/gp47 family protein [Burkholderia vietnamiensis]MDN7814920.1 baseplate J/gp47 family protein [Burkholderia vietnamiensis]
MPYARKTLAQLRADAMADIAAALEGSDPLLRYAALKIIGVVLAGMTNEEYGYLDWIAKQTNPFTAEGEYLEAWGALKKVFRKDASAASLSVSFIGTSGKQLDENVPVVRGDGVTYTTSATEVVVGTTVSTTVIADVAGSAGNADPGTVVSLGVAVDGIQSTGVVTGTVSSGADIEDQEQYRARVLGAYQNPPQGGDRADYVSWALDVPGVTRAWCAPNAFGAGTVVVYVMMDEAQVSHGGFPQGTNGVSQFDQGPGGLPRDTPATGDQLVVADALITLEPVTALVYVCAPIRNTLSFQISGLSTASTATKSAISLAISDVLFRNSDPRGGTVNRSDLNTAIGSIPATAGFVIESINGVINGVTTPYPDNITGSFGSLPVLGTVNYI